MTSAVHRPAVQYVLHRKIDVDTDTTASDLDAIGEGREGTVRPTAAAILGEMLVAISGTVVDPVLVAPRELVGEVLHERREVVEVRRVLALNPVRALGLQVPNRTFGPFGNKGGSGSEEESQSEGRLHDGVVAAGLQHRTTRPIDRPNRLRPTRAIIQATTVHVGLRKRSAVNSFLRAGILDLG